jgi:hypothetical protein
MQDTPVYTGKGKYGRTKRSDSTWLSAKIRKGMVVFEPTSNHSALDILDPSFFSVKSRFLVDYGAGVYDLLLPESDNGAQDLEDQDVYPKIWTLSDKLAKSAWSTILVDLGQSQTSNILLDTSKLSTFTQDFEEAHKNLANAHPGPEMYSFNTTTPPRSGTGPLETSPSTISTEYVCNVPRRKANGTLAWSIIIADLVFLQTAWMVFKLVVDYYLGRKVACSNFCGGCFGEPLLAASGQERCSQHVEGGLFGLKGIGRRPSGYERQVSDQS